MTGEIKADDYEAEIELACEGHGPCEGNETRWFRGDGKERVLCRVCYARAFWDWASFGTGDTPETWKDAEVFGTGDTPETWEDAEVYCEDVALEAKK